jgi:hypothetical protein
MTPGNLLSSNPTVGLTSTSLTQSNDNLICKFTRDKQNDAVANYANLNNPFYLLVSTGPVWVESKKKNFNKISYTTSEHQIYQK